MLPLHESEGYLLYASFRITHFRDPAKWSVGRTDLGLDPMKNTFLVQYELDGVWHTIAKRSSFKAATAKALYEGRAMKWAHQTSVIREGDPEALRYRAEDGFTLRVPLADRAAFDKALARIKGEAA